MRIEGTSLDARGARRFVATGGVSFAMLTALVGVGVTAPACSDDSAPKTFDDVTMINEGQAIFRNDTFGDEVLWTDTLRLHEALATVSPMVALSVGLKVDADLVPAGVLATADLTSPATTLALLKLGAVVGVKGTVVTEAGGDRLTRVGVTCGLCHSTVDNSAAAGVGHRIDGEANRDLNPGAIIALSPALSAEQKADYMSWGPGKYDPRYNADGIKNGPVLIPPVYGLSQAKHATYSGDGDIRYWNDYVAVTQMGGQGEFKDDRIGVDKELPAGTPDLVEPKLNALRYYQFSLPVPAPAPGSFDPAAADRGRATFDQRCGSCHNGDALSDDDLHAPEETGVDPTYAERSASNKYRATPLRALARHAPYFHDGSAATLPAVVDHYDQHLQLGLGAPEKSDLVEYLKSL
jgi:hypothetical protein